MAKVGDIYYYSTAPQLRIEVREVLEPFEGLDRITGVVVGTHNHAAYPIGHTMTWTLDRYLVLDKPPVSICSCYWSKHPLYCKCK